MPGLNCTRGLDSSTDGDWCPHNNGLIVTTGGPSFDIILLNKIEENWWGKRMQIRQIRMLQTRAMRELL